MSSRTVSKDFQVLGNRETVKTNKGPVTSRFKLSWQSNELPDKGIRGPVSLGRVNDERKLGRLFFLFFSFFFVVSIGWSEEMDRRDDLGTWQFLEGRERKEIPKIKRPEREFFRIYAVKLFIRVANVFPRWFLHRSSLSLDYNVYNREKRRRR